MNTRTVQMQQVFNLPTFLKRHPEPIYGSAEIANLKDLSSYLKKTDHCVSFQNTAQIIVNDANFGYEINESDFHIPRNILVRGMLAVGQTGAGKTERFIKPLCLSSIKDSNASIVLIDFKGNLRQELGAIAEHYRENVDIRVINLTNAQRTTHGWNPIANSTADDNDYSVLFDDVHSLCEASENKNSDESVFWQNGAEGVICANAKILQRELGSVCLADIRNVLDLEEKEFLRFLKKHSDVPYASYFHGFYGSGSHNALTVMATAKGYLQGMLDRNLAAATSKNEFRFEDLFEKPVILILEVSQPDVDKLRPYLNLFFIQLFRSIFRYADSQAANRLPRPLTIILDDFAAAIGRIPQMDTYLNVCRSRDVAIVAATQTLGQLGHYYGTEAEGVISGFSTKLFISPIEVEDSIYASKQSGNCTIQTAQISYSHNGNALNNKLSSHTIIPAQRSLLLPEEIRLSTSHSVYGRASTLYLPDAPPVQLFLIPSYLQPEYIGLTEKASKAPREENLRKDKLVYTWKLQIGEENVTGANNITNTAGWTNDEVKIELEKVKNTLEWNNTTGSARTWWMAFEAENQHRLSLVFRLAEELAVRNATITEFFLAYVYSNTENIQANLFYLDYTRLKKEEEKRKKEAAQAADQTEIVTEPNESVIPEDSEDFLYFDDYDEFN